MINRNELQDILHTEIPLTRSIGICVEHCDENRIVLTAPLEPNINHKCTAFGGSLYSVAVLCGWSFVYYQLKLNDLTGHIVIQQSSVDYQRPVDGQIRAICTLQNKAVIQRFLTTYKRKSRARIKLQVKIVFNDTDAMIFDGQYVVHQ